MYTVLLDRRG